jgi:FixJ family two-component response regulator
VKVGGRGRVVLVVEDDASMREAIETLLSVAGFSAVLYGSAEEILAADVGELPFCVISDLNLPVMSGLDLLTELRRRSGQARVIIITAYDSAPTRAEALRRGAVQYLAKPFPGSALLAAIEDISAQAGSA